MIRCPNCTAQLDYDVSSQQIHCDYCGSTFDPKEFQTEIKKSEEVEVETYEGMSYTCSQCGASLLTFDETAITFCSYCGSQAMIESKLIKKNNPKYIIPFKKTKEECISQYKKKINSSLFAPDYMKSDVVVDKFRGIYIPYCVYKLQSEKKSTNNGSKYSHRRGDYIYYDDYTIRADIDAEYEGISYDMISNLYDEFSTAIPHNFQESEEFNTNYLAGFYADTSDVNDYIYEDNATSIVTEDSTNHLRKCKEYSQYGCSKPTAYFNVVDKKMGMFPLYFLAIRDKKEKYVNYAIVNGQTGKVVVDLPVDFKKYILFSLLLTIPIFLVTEAFLVLTPKTVCLVSMAAAVISMIISLIQMNSMHNREYHINDEGYMDRNKDKKTPKSKIQLKYIIKQIIAIGLGLFVLIMNFVADYYYYGAAIIMFILIIISFYDLVKEHNLLVSTKLPQLEVRGGSENE